MLARFHDVSKSYGAVPILRNVSFEIHAEQKIGLIGANGAGKTTLLRLIQNPDDTDQGEVILGTGVRIGRLDQLPEFGEKTVLDEALSSFGNVQAMERRLREMEEGMTTEADPLLLERYSKLQDEFEFRGGYRYRAQTESALSGVGFTSEQFPQLANSLSGGEKNRLALARLLLSEVDLLLLDEPTNHLDVRAIDWLERYLTETKTSLLIVSHDRLFLDRTVGHILELENGTIQSYRGNYSSCVRQRRERLKLRRKEWERQQEWIAQTEDYVRRNIAGQRTKQAQSRRKALERMTRIEKPGTEPRGARFRFSKASETRRYVIQARNLRIGYATCPILENVGIEVERGQRWALLGPNGSGKTTLLRSLIGRLAPLGGDLNWDSTLPVGYYDQEMKDLEGRRTVLEEMRALDARTPDGELRSFLAQFLFRGDDVFKRVEQLSGGEQSKLILAKIIYESPPVLALDEPTNHLDIASREALETALAAYPGTMLFISHDRRLVQQIATRILYIAGDQIRTFADFEDFEQWLESEVTVLTPSGQKPPNKASANKASRKSPGPRLSKNRREQMEAALLRLESTIDAREREIEEIEMMFQKPPAELDWDRTHQRYASLKAELSRLYQDLSHRLELLQEGAE